MSALRLMSCASLCCAVLALHSLAPVTVKTYGIPSSFFSVKGTSSGRLNIDWTALGSATSARSSSPRWAPLDSIASCVSEGWSTVGRPCRPLPESG